MTEAPTNLTAEIARRFSFQEAKTIEDPKARREWVMERARTNALAGVGAAWVTYANFEIFGFGGVFAQAGALTCAYGVTEWRLRRKNTEVPATKAIPTTQAVAEPEPEEASELGRQIAAATGIPPQLISIAADWENIGGGAVRALIRLAPPASPSGLEAKRRHIAAALVVAEHQVLISVDPYRNDAGMAAISVYPGDPWSRDATHLSEAVQSSIFDGIDFGTNLAGEPVRLDLIERSMLIGGLPGYGKTVSAMTVLSQTVTDPRVRHWISDGKNVDLPAIIPVAYRYVGNSQADFLAVLEEIEALGRRKLEALAEVGRQEIDREVIEHFAAMDPTHPLAAVDLLNVDELSIYTRGKDRELNVRIGQMLTGIVERYRCAGVVVILATQRPSVEVVPGSLRDLIGIRCAHLCATAASSNAVLGDGTAGDGFDASDLRDKGTAWLKVNGRVTQVRPHFTKAPRLEESVCVGIDVRMTAGTMPESLDVGTMAETPRILTDARGAIVASGGNCLSTADLITGLRRIDVEHYFPVTPSRLAARLAGYGISPKPLGDYNGKNARGYRLAWIESAILAIEEAKAQG